MSRTSPATVYHIQASCTIFHPENSAKKSPLSTIIIQRYGTAAHANVDTRCLLPLHALTTPLILHTNLHRRLRELLLRLALTVHLVLFAGRVTADVLLSVPSLNISIKPPFAQPAKSWKSKVTYSLASLLLADCTSSWSFLRVVCVESGFLPLVSPLAFLEVVVLKGWAAAARGLMRVVVLRVGATSARRENVRKPDIVGDVWVGRLRCC